MCVDLLPPPSLSLFVPLFYLNEAHKGLLSMLILDNLIRSWKSDKLTPLQVKGKINLRWEGYKIKVANLQEGNLWKTKKKNLKKSF